MCGIAGFYSHQFNQDDSRNLIERMLSSMAFRGPDNMGFDINCPVTLGHNRLAIIDLSSNSNQPMIKGDFSLVLNGEIYNYKELRGRLIAEGVGFTTNSDTEVVLNSYIHWGEKCVDYFIGMWAFAIYNRHTKVLFLSRDRFGIKPLHYIFNNGSLYFGSDYKPLKQTPAFRNELNQKQIVRGLSLGWSSYEKETYFNCIHSLPAAHNIIYDGISMRIEKYYHPGNEKKITNLSDAAEEFRLLFLQSVKMHLHSDVPVGACLSGGIDSSSIVSSMAYLFPEKRIKAFNVYYDDGAAFDERKWISYLTSQYSNLDVEFISPKNSDLLDGFQSSTFHMDVPLSSSSLISQHFLMKEISKSNIKVVLDGQGADEYLGGYFHSFDRLIGSMFRKFQFLKLAKTIINHQSLHKLSSSRFNGFIMKSLLASVLSENSLRVLESKYKEKSVYSENVHKGLFRLKNHGAHSDIYDDFVHNQLYTTILPNLLHFEDRNSMAYSIESRVPFLDHRLIDYVFSLDSMHLFHQGSTKHVLRESMKGILPDPIAARHDKIAFATPVESNWLKGPLRPLLEIDLKQLDFIDQKAVNRIIESYISKGQNSTLTWRLASLNYWLKQV